MRHTLVAVHAHPDDEALLGAGTLAKAAAEGHRVILVVATDGDMGLTSDEFRGEATDGTTTGSAGGSAHTVTTRLGERRLAELQASADALGVARVVYLGYGDSGMVGEVPPDEPGRPRLLHVDPAEAAQRLADLLRAEQADVVLGYDANGGYGHRDHVRVHEIVRLAALQAKTPRLLEVTVPRDILAHTVETVAKVYTFPPAFDPTQFRRSFSPGAQITHRVDVRRFASAKRASMRAHASQAAANDGADRTLAAFLRIPDPVYGLVFGREWYVDATGLAPGQDAPLRPRRGLLSRLPGGHDGAGRLEKDVFAGL